MALYKPKSVYKLQKGENKTWKVQLSVAVVREKDVQMVDHGFNEFHDHAALEVWLRSKELDICTTL